MAAGKSCYSVKIQGNILFEFGMYPISYGKRLVLPPDMAKIIILFAVETCFFHRLTFIITGFNP